ncbi:putative rhamnogalacturonate lyase C [Pseudocercospora fuligena]|uniref:Putative rhamnogalacturonate lyase C n=1 Tax=Pseudocercospora fuligena TaxID=685502 RepID=A0A8H6R9J0_9PEZI|nr:putative rhamnogalacturonate lyase C [Pseudocercospora fuligena]
MARGPWDIPSIITQCLSPAKLIVRILSLIFSFLRPYNPVRQNVTLVCISDTHNLIPKQVPFGDVLIHAGDLTQGGTPSEIQAQVDWLDSLPHQYKIVIAGNHDSLLEVRSRGTLDLTDQNVDINWRSIIYLQGDPAKLHFPSRGTHGDGCTLKVYGSPIIPHVGGPEHAFQVPRTKDLWTGRVPQDTDVLISHTPPRYHLDLPGVSPLGCEYLLREVRRVKPAVHIFGHVHAARSDIFGRLCGGQEIVRWDLAERHLEGVLSTASPDGLLSLILSLANPVTWYHLCGFWFYSLRALVLERLFWTEPPPATRMVNAALMRCDEGWLGNEPQVIHI